MIISLFFIALFTASIFFEKRRRSEIYIFTVISGTLLFFCILFFVIQRSNSRDFVRSFNSISETIQSQRAGAEPLERAALTNKMMELNSDLVIHQHYAQSPWTNWFYDTSTGLLTLKPLR